MQNGSSGATYTFSGNLSGSGTWAMAANVRLAKFTFVIVPHRYIHAILVLILLFALLETFILDVNPVFTQSLLDELRDLSLIHILPLWATKWKALKPMQRNTPKAPKHLKKMCIRDRY